MGSVSNRSSWRLARRAACAAAFALAACHTAPPRTAPDPVADAEAHARRAIANERSLTGAALSEHTVGVVPFLVPSADTALTPLSYGLSDLLMTDLSRSRQLTVVDRLQLDALLRELDLARAGRVDSATAPRVGRLAGAGRLIVGSLAAAAEGNLLVDTRIADVPRSTVGAGVTATAPLDRILDAEKSLAFRLFDAMGVTLTPAEHAAVEQRPTKDIAAFLAYGRGVHNEVLARYEDAAQDYQAALAIDPTFALARQRLRAVQLYSAARRAGGSNAQSASSAADALTRVGYLTAGRVNQPVLTAVQEPRLGGGPADPSFPTIATLLIVISNPP